ncbi:class I SAM-dependent methyltransferase (plasmid) [Tistrella bauzanensis]|uniref:class I SAM-dependent DNA methyltransferase n=1 Tax=Tistrella TaxID=171436 RepID=UPI0031F703FE
MTIAAFDPAAADYDRDFTRSLTGAAQRRLVRAHLDRRLAEPGRSLRVLELTCGTGEDALHMAGLGHQVLATDLSGAMLARTEAKLVEAKLAGTAPGGGVRMRRLAVEALAAGEPLDAEDEAAGFDLVFSDFGGLNCIGPDVMAALARRLAGLVRPGGRVILVVMPHLCLWEAGWNLARLRPRAAFRRLRRGPVATRIGDQPLTIWYHGAAALRRAFAGGFVCDAVHPIGLAVPPSALEPAFARRPRLISGLEAVDRLLARCTWLAGCADHLLIDVRRVA